MFFRIPPDAPLRLVGVGLPPRIDPLLLGMVMVIGLCGELNLEVS